MRDVTTNNTPGAPPPRHSRRSFLARAAGASALAVPALGLVSAPKASAAPSKKVTGLTAELLQEIMNDEAAHVRIIQNLLNDPDNPLPVPIRKPPKLDTAALTQKTFDDFLEAATVFENTGSGLYHGACSTSPRPRSTSRSPPAWRRSSPATH